MKLRRLLRSTARAAIATGRFIIVQLLIVSLVFMPAGPLRGAFTDSNGNYDIWTEAGRAGHSFAIQEATDTNSPNHFALGGLWLPGGNRIHGNYGGSEPTNGMVIRDLTTNDVAPLPDWPDYTIWGVERIQIPSGSWAPADGSSIRRVYFTVDSARAWNSLALVQSDGTTYPVSVDTNSEIWGGFSGDRDSYWPPTLSWDNQTFTGSAIFDPYLPFRIVDLTTNERSAENETNIANIGQWEPLPLPAPIEEVRMVLPAFAANQNFTVHTQVPWGPISHQACTAVPCSYWYDWAVNTWNYVWSDNCAILTFTAPVGAAFWITNTYTEWPAGGGCYVAPEIDYSMYSFDALDFPAPPPPPTVAVTLRINAESFPSDPASPWVTDSLANHYWQLWTTAGMAAEINPSYGINTFTSGNEYISTHPQILDQVIDNPIALLTLTAQVPEGVDWWAYDATTGQTMAIGQTDFLNGWTPHIPAPAVISSLDIHADRLNMPGYSGICSIGIAPQSYTSTPDSSSIRWISVSSWNPNWNSGTPMAGTIVNYDREFWSDSTYDSYTLPYTHLEFEVPPAWGSDYVLLIYDDYYTDAALEIIPLSVGPTDDTTWRPAPQPVYLSISESRWSHNLVLRQIDGTEYPVFPGQTQGDTSWNAGSANHAWQNSYYYFDANTQATPGMAWRIVDKTNEDEAGAGETNLIEWIALMPPIFTQAGIDDVGYYNLALAAPISQNATYTLERSHSGSPWVVVYQTELALTPEGTEFWYQDSPYVEAGTYRFRARASFGGRHSAYSAIMSHFAFDTDGDGLSDNFEVFGPNPTNPFLIDTDGDGLTDADEFAQGTNPNSNDTDSDGMPDAWEVTYGLMPTVNDANCDFDFDTAHNLTEFLNGTNPADHYDGNRPNIAPPQPTTASAQVADGRLRVEWNDNSISETAFAIYKRTLDPNGAVVYQLLGKETPAATLFETPIALEEVLEGDQIVVIAEPSTLPPANYVAALVNQPLMVLCNEVAQTYEVVYMSDGDTILARTPVRTSYAPAPSMNVSRAPTKENMQAATVSINSNMMKHYSPGHFGISHSVKEYSTIALNRVEGEEWKAFAVPTTDSYSASHNFGIGKVNTLAVYTGNDFQSAGGLSAFLDEKHATISGEVSVHFYSNPYDPDPTVPSISGTPDLWAQNSGQWFHRDFDISQTATQSLSGWPILLGTWEATEGTNLRDESFVFAGTHDLDGYWQWGSIGLPADTYATESLNISVDGSYSYPLPARPNGRRFIIPRAWGTVTGDAEKRFDPLADSYPTYFAIPEPNSWHQFSIHLHGNPGNAAEHNTQWTVATTGGVTFTDGLTSKTYSELTGTEVGFQANNHGEITFTFGDVFAGKIIVKAYPRTTLSVLHVQVTHTDSSGATSQGSDWGVAFPVTNSIGLHHTPVDREVWVNGGPNIEFIHTNRRLELKLNYTVKNNKSYEPAYTHTNADAFANELRAGLGNEIINQYDIICFWVHGGGNGVAGLAPINRNTIVLHRPAPDTFAHEAGHAMGLFHPFDWIQSKEKPADANSMIMGYYAGMGFPGSQIDEVRRTR